MNDKDDVQKKKEALLAYSVLGVGLILFWKNTFGKRDPGYGPGDKLYEEVTRAFSPKSLEVQHGRSAIDRKIDNLARSQDPALIERATHYEMQRIKDESVAKSAAIEHLLADPNYYDSLEDTG